MSIEKILYNAEHFREYEFMMKNGLNQAVIGNFPGSGPNQAGQQIGQADTMWNTLRWYLISNMRQLITQLYAEIGLVQTIVDVPVDDGLRGGVDFKSKQLSADQINELQIYFEREDIINSSIAQALKWNRLFGGAGIIVMTDQDPLEMLNIQAIRVDSPLEFRAVDMWELFSDKQDTDTFDSSLNEKVTQYSYRSRRIDASRVITMKGVKAPSLIRPRLRGWGMSVLETLVRSINQYFKSTALTFEVLDEFKIDTYKLKGLANLLQMPDGGASVRQRVAMMNQLKNYLNAIVLDSEDEYEQKELSFQGISETLQGIRMQVASDMRMPLSKLFGIAATGFSSGEDDIENYNAMVTSSVRAKCKYDILNVGKIVCQKLFQMVPDDLQCDFKPLRILSAEMEENVKSQKFARLMTASDKGLVSVKECKDACNKENLLPIQLDSSVETLETEFEPEPPQGNGPPGSSAPPKAGNAKHQAQKPKEAE